MKNFNEASFFKQKAFWSLFSLLAAWLFYFWPVVSSLFREDNQLWIRVSTYAIIFATGYLIYISREALKNTLLVSSQLGLFVLFLFASAFVFADVLRIPSVEKSSVLLMVPALVLTTLGPAAIKPLLFPLLYLMLIIPLQDSTLQNRSWVVWVSIGLFIFYLRYMKFYKPKHFLELDSAWAFQNARWLIPTGIAFSMLMVSPWLGENIRSFYPPKHREITMRAPLGTDGWTGPFLVRSQAWAPIYPNASARLQAQYFSNSGDKTPIYLYSAYFDSNRPFSEVLDSKNLIYDSAVWKKNSFNTREVEIDKNYSATVFEVELQSGAVSRLVWYWYYIAGVSTTNLMVADVLDRVRIIAKYAQGSGVIAVSTFYNAESEEARKNLSDFLKGMYYSLDVIKRPEITYTR